MKSVIMVRHSKASSKDLPIIDKDRPLRKRGKNDLELIKPALLKHALKPEHIFSSSANRAAQTATILAGFYNMSDSISFFDEFYNATPREIFDFITKRDDGLRSIMIVGHNPELTEAADLLWKDSFDAPVPTSACICLSFDIDRWDRIRANTGNMEYYEYPRKYK